MTRINDLFPLKNSVQTVVFLFSVLSILNTSQAQWVNEESICRTPDQKFGVCTRINDCDPMTTAIQAVPKPIPPEVAAKIREYQCDRQSSSIKVCCPSGPIHITTENQGGNNGNGAGEDLSRHRNYNLLPVNCGPMDEDNNKVINGDNTTLFEFPWMALLSYRTPRGPDFKCGGAIINEHYILTAAHCVQNLKDPLIGVRIGEHNIPTTQDCETREGGEVVCAPPVQDFAIEKIIAHPADPTDRFANDIALIRVSRMNLQPQNAKPICLPFGDKQYKDIDGKLLIVSGWGITEKGVSSPYLLKVDVPAMSVSQCKEIYRNEVKITDKQICARGVNKKDACSGDSGGPMQLPLYHNNNVRYVIFGVVSFGTRACDPDVRPGVYTRVGPYLKWILDTIRR